MCSLLLLVLRQLLLRLLHLKVSLLWCRNSVVMFGVEALMVDTLFFNFINFHCIYLLILMLCTIEVSSLILLFLYIHDHLCTDNITSRAYRLQESICPWLRTLTVEPGHVVREVNPVCMCAWWLISLYLCKYKHARDHCYSLSEWVKERSVY